MKNIRNLIMSKKLKSLIVSAFVTTAVLCTSTVSAYADIANGKYTKTRLGGSDRFDTAIEISKYYVKNSKETVTNCIIARCDDYGDTISIAPFSFYKNAPMLLTEKDQLNTKTQARLKEMNVKNVYIIGGTGVVSENVESQLKALGYAVTRIGGKDRYETNRLLMKQIPKELWGPHPKIVNGMDWVQGLTVAADTPFNIYKSADTTTYINPVFIVSPTASSAEDIKDIADELQAIKPKWENVKFITGAVGAYKVCIDNNLTMNAFKKVYKQGDNIIDVMKPFYATFTGDKGLQEINQIETAYNKNTRSANLAINYNCIGQTANDAYTERKMGTILTTGDNFIDALAVSPLAARFKMHIVTADKPASEVMGHQIGFYDLARTFAVYGFTDEVIYCGGSAVMPEGREVFLHGDIPLNGRW